MPYPSRKTSTCEWSPWELQDGSLVAWECAPLDGILDIRLSPTILYKRGLLWNDTCEGPFYGNWGNWTSWSGVGVAYSSKACDIFFLFVSAGWKLVLFVRDDSAIYPKREILDVAVWGPIIQRFLYDGEFKYPHFLCIYLNDRLADFEVWVLTCPFKCKKP